MGFVYHGSSVQDLKEIKPMNHGQVYAAKDKIIAILFIVNRNTGRYTYARTVGHLNDGTLPYIAERYANAFDDLYNGKSGSVYVLDDKFFCSDRPGVAMSRTAVPVVQEIKIPDLKQYLLDLENRHQLKIYRYPDRPSSIPSDDSDLVQMCQKFNSLDKLQEFKELFPDVYQRNKDKFECIENKNTDSNT